MKFKRLFFDNVIDFKSISKIRWITSIVLGILSAVIIYFIFSVLIDGFRLVFSDLQNSPILTSAYNRSLYNMLFASLSLIFGNSIFITLLLTKPSTVFSRGNTKRFRIFNDQVVLNGFFMTWFGKMALVFGSFSFVFLDFQILSDYYWIFILLVSVMYLETWKALLQVLGKRKYRLLSIHFLVFILLSFGLSKIDVSNYKKLDSVLLHEIPTYNLPNSYFNSSSRNLYRNPFISIGIKLDENENVIIRTEDRQFIQLKELRTFLVNERSMFPEELIPKIIVILSIDYDMKLKHIKAVEAELFNNSIHKIWYQTNNLDLQAKRYLTAGFTKRLNNKSVLDFEPKTKISGPPLLPFPEIDESIFSKRIKVDINDTIKIDNVIIKKNELVNEFQKNIDSTTLFEYYLNPNIRFQKYIDVLSAHNKAIYNLRQNRVSFDILSPNYRYSDYEKEKLKALVIQFPILIKEFKIQK